VTADCRALRPLLGAYVLGALEADEAEEVREHLAACPGCAAEHARLSPLPDLLRLADGAHRAAAEPLSPKVEERLLDAVAAEAPRRRQHGRLRLPRLARPRLLLAGGLASAVLAGAAVVAVTRAPGYDQEVHLHAAGGWHGASGEAELDDVAGGTAMHLRVSGLPPDRAAVYEVRCESPDWSASAGTFRADASGRADVVLATAARQGQYDRLRIVRRTSGGTQPVLAAAVG
jgi:anti-sigma factor RsiW